jgi:hypothetical protein
MINCTLNPKKKRTQANIMSKQEYNNAAGAASSSLLCLSGAGRDPGDDLALSIAPGAGTPLPPPLVDRISSQICNIATFRPGMSGCVRVHPDHFPFYLSTTYPSCPGGPGENQHTQAHARARVFRFFLSDLLFNLKLKVPGHPGRRPDINNLRSDIHPDAPGPPGPMINGGLLLCH